MLENGRLRAELGRDGLLRSLVERATGREALAGPGNVHAALRRPADGLRRLGRRPVPPGDGAPTRRRRRRARVISVGPLRAEVAIERPIGPDSTMRQVVRLDAGSPRLEFHCEADWRESNTMLKVLFPVAVHAANATYQMQFGHAERPTHYSTSHDLARYEVPGHRFADLSEHGFGVALLTDCKYGYSTYGNEMRISLLRSPQVPDPHADVGRARVRLRGDAARRRLARGRRGGRGGALRDADPLGAGGGGALVLLGRRPQPGARHGQARRGLRRAGAAAVRVPRRPRHGPPAGRRPVHRGAALQPAGGRRAPSCRSRTARSSSPTGRTRSSACCSCNNGVRPLCYTRITECLRPLSCNKGV